MLLLCVRYQPCNHSGTADLLLLWAFPSIRMGEDELDVVLQRSPHRSTTSMRLDDVVSSAAEEISHEICENLDGTFTLGKGWDVCVFDVRRFQMLCSQVKLPPNSVL